MPKKFEAQIKDLGGGLNDSYDPAVTNPRLSKKLTNFFLYGVHGQTRNGIIKQTDSAYSEKVTGLFAYGKTVGSWALIAGVRSGLARLSSGVLVALPNLDSVIVPSSDDIWRMKQYKGIGYAVRPGVASLLRFTEAGYSVAGIAAPTAAPTAAAGAGGTMEAGDRHVVMTFFNPDTDVESNPSSASNSVTLVANDRITMTNCQLPTNPQVGGRRFYVELPGIVGQYYLALETLDVSSTGPFIIDKKIDALGSLASFKNAQPQQMEYIDVEVFKERLWLTDGFDVFFSQNLNGVGLAECFSATDFIEIYPDDRNHVTCLVAFGERLVVGKTNGVHVILASGASFEVQTISDRQGCIAGGSMRAAEGLLWWYSGENVYQTSGSGLEAISDPASVGGSRVRAILDTIPDAYKSTVQASVHPRLGWYILSVPTGDSTIPTHALVYDYRNRRWFIFEHATYGGPTVFGDFLDAQEQARVYCAFDGVNNVYDFIGTEATLDDDGVPIECEWRSAGSDCGAPGFMHVLRHGGILVDPINEVCSVSVYEDGSDTPTVTRNDVSLNQSRQLQRMSLPSVRSFSTQLGLTYSGQSKLKLKGAFFEADVWGYKEQPE